MPANLESIEQALKTLFIGKIVSCPLYPIEIPGIVAADAFDANDCFGTIFQIPVPKNGVLHSATFWDLDYEGTQVDFMIYGNPITQIASDAAWAPSDADQLVFVTALSFVSYIGHVNSYTFELNNIGKAYSAARGKFDIQAVTRATPTIAAGAMPRFQLQILSFDPDFMER